MILALCLDFGSLGISFENMGVDFRHWEFILASGSQFWYLGFVFATLGVNFGLCDVGPFLASGIRF